MAQDSPKKATIALILESQGLALALGEDLRRCGYNIEVYNKPDAALMPILRGRYQVIITEHLFKNSQMGGEELIRSLRQSQLPKVDKLPVIILLKHHVDAVVRQLRKLGANGVLSQPIDPGIVHNMIQQLLNRPSVESLKAKAAGGQTKKKAKKTERRKQPYIEGSFVKEEPDRLSNPFKSHKKEKPHVVEKTVSLIEDDLPDENDLIPDFPLDIEEPEVEKNKPQNAEVGDGNYLGLSSPMLWLVSLLGIALGVLSFSAVGMMRINVESILTSMLIKQNGNVAWLSLQADPMEKKFTGINLREYEMIRSGLCSLCKNVSPLVYGPYKSSLAQYNGLTKQVSLIGVDVGYSPMNGHKIRKGRLIDQQDISLGTPMAVIAHEVAKEFFPQDYAMSVGEDVENTKRFDPIGKMIRIGRLKLVVVGVLEPLNMQLVSKLGSQRGYSVNRQVMIPYTYYLNRLGSTAINELQIEPRKQNHMDKAIAQVVQVLRDNNKKDTRYHVEGVTDWVEQAKDKIWLLSLAIMLLAAFAFTLGSLAVMSLVHNATAKRTDHFSPRFQAFLDSIFISVVAGLLGAILSYLMGRGLTALLDSNIELSWTMTLFGVGMAVLVGLVTGQHSARRAPQYIDASY